MNLNFKKRMDKTTENKANNHLQWDVIKWITPIILSMIGLFLWVAGTAYEAGFWHFLGISNSPVSITFQRTAFSGLFGPISTWINALLIVSAYGAILFFIALFFSSIAQKKRPVPKFIAAIQKWLHETVSENPEVFNFSIFLIFFGFIGIFTILPLAAAVHFAHNEGIEYATKEICKAKTEKKLKSTIYLHDGRKVDGNFWERTEKFSILVNEKEILIVSVGDKPQILDTTSIVDVKCPKP